MMTPNFQFLVKIPPELAQELEDFLQEKQVQFDTLTDMVYISNDNVLDKIFTGREIEETLEAVNSYARQAGQPTHPREPHEMDLRERQDFLHFINVHTSWGTSYDDIEVEDFDPNMWQRFLETHRKKGTKPA